MRTLDEIEKAYSRFLAGVEARFLTRTSLTEMMTPAEKATHTKFLKEYMEAMKATK